MTFGGLVDPQAFCGQEQPHWPHRWVTSGGTYAACSGKSCSCAAQGCPVPRAGGGIVSGWLRACQCDSDSATYEDDDGVLRCWDCSGRVPSTSEGEGA